MYEYIHVYITPHSEDLRNISQIVQRILWIAQIFTMHVRVHVCIYTLQVSEFYGRCVGLLDGSVCNVIAKKNRDWPKLLKFKVLYYQAIAHVRYMYMYMHVQMYNFVYTAHEHLLFWAIGMLLTVHTCVYNIRTLRLQRSRKVRWHNTTPFPRQEICVFSCFGWDLNPRHSRIPALYMYIVC